MTQDDWTHYSMHILNELDRLNKQQEELANQVTNLRIQISQIDTAFKIKSGIWGLMGGAVPVIVSLLIWMFRNL